MFKNNFTRADIIITAFLLIISLSSYFIFVQNRNADSANNVSVYINGKHINDISLNANNQYSFLDGEFVVEVSDGTASVIKTHCNDRVCKNMHVNKHGGEIICLPNKVIIRHNEALSNSTDLYAG